MKSFCIKIAIYSIFIILLLAGCSKAKTNVENLELFKTWKFIAFGTLNNTIRPVHPIDCDICYIINIKNDSTIEGRSVMNTYSGEILLSENNFTIYNFAGTEVYEEGDPEIYITNLPKVFRFQIIGSRLRLFYDSNNFLLFEPNIK